MLKTGVRSCFSKLKAVHFRSLHEANAKLDSKEPEEIRIPVPWGHIAGKWWGDTSKRPLIGLHGWEDNAGTFDSLAPLLKIPSFLAIDWPGHGLSSHHPFGRPYSVLDSLLVLRRLAKDFKWETLSLLGHSYGSCMSFVYSALFPGSVDTFISIECARTLMVQDFQADLKQMRLIADNIIKIEERMKANKPPSYSFDQIVDLYCTGTLESVTKESCKILLKRGMLPSQKPNTFYFSRDPRLRNHSIGRFPYRYLLELAPRIKCNHLAIRGLQGLLFEGERQEVYLKTFDLIKKPEYICELHGVEGTHHLHLNNPERLAPIINHFLNLCKWWGRRDVKPLLGLHGWQDNANTWDRVAPLLPSEISLLAFDSPGHGLSSHFAKGIPYRITDQIFVLRHIVKHFGWENVSLLGHSLGAVQSFLYAALYPDQVENLLLIDSFKPLSIDPKTDIDKLALETEKCLKAEDFDDSIKQTYSYNEAVQRLYDGAVGHSLSEDACEILMKRGTERIGNGYFFTRDSLLKSIKLSGYIHEYVLYMTSCITCNVLVIKAVPGLVYESVKVNSEALESIKKSAKVFAFHTVQGSHHVHLNNPERVAPIIIKFLKFSGSISSNISTAALEKLTNKEHLHFM